MSTPSECLEADIWLGGTGQQLSDEQRTALFARVDRYYRRNPTSTYGADILGILRDHDAAFTRILESVCPPPGQSEDAEA